MGDPVSVEGTPSPSPRSPPLTSVLQAGRNIPRMKAPRRGPLMTPMMVKEPWESGLG